MADSFERAIENGVFSVLTLAGPSVDDSTTPGHLDHSTSSDDFEDAQVLEDDPQFQPKFRCELNSDPEIELLSISPESPSHQQLHRDYGTAPLMTRDAYVKADIGGTESQYGVLGEVLGLHSKYEVYKPEDRRLYLNTNAPVSAVICGLQGSGKSHTVSAMMESMFIPSDRKIGDLQKPLCGMVLHIGDGSQPNEAAWLAVPKDDYRDTKTPSIAVFVSPSSVETMRRIYSPLGKRVSVSPLRFREEELDAQAFLSLMAVGEMESAPLYIHILLSILRELGENFTYRKLKRELDENKDFNLSQAVGLRQRLSILESFLESDSKKAKKMPARQRFVSGQLTIIDLSDPFIDPASACGIFEVLTRMFVRARVDTGKVLIVDEAHKYLSAAGSSNVAGLTKSLLTLIREQRHKGIRVIISTQEPTVVPPALLELCSVVILHRFSSPSWWQHVVKHVSTADAFERLISLQTGEAIVLAPTALYVNSEKEIAWCGQQYLHIRVRRRVTADGGESILAI